jgi:prepilin-type N-terminal cleavage/methylation domain-containing protein
MTRPHSVTTISTRKWCGFTLVECLVVILVTAILIGLVAQGVSSSRTSAQRLSQQCAGHNLGISFAAYFQGNQDKPPELVDLVREWPAPQLDIVRYGTTYHGFAWPWVTKHFPLALGPEIPYATYVPQPGPAVCFGYPPIAGPQGRPPESCNFELTHAVYAADEYFTPEGQIGPSQWGPRQVSDTVFPSLKGLLIYNVLPPCNAQYPDPDDPVVSVIPRDQRLIVFIDQSAAWVPQDLLSPGVENRFFQSARNPSTISRYSAGFPVLETLLGLSGRDR